jgi:hypothetical protein
LIADKPEVNPGETIQITPVLSDIYGGGRAMGYFVEACFGSFGFRGVESTCEGTPLSQVVIPSTAPMAVTGLVAPNYTAAVNPFSLTVPPIPAEVIPYLNDAFNGVRFAVLFHVRLSTGEVFHARKEILVSTRTTKNQNPVFTDLTVSGAPLTSLPAASVSISAVPGGAGEQYEFHGTDGTWQLTESMKYTYLASDGVMAESSDPTVSYDPPKAPPVGRNVVIIGVARDLRGGTAVKILFL